MRMCGIFEVLERKDSHLARLVRCYEGYGRVQMAKHYTAATTTTATMYNNTTMVVAEETAATDRAVGKAAVARARWAAAKEATA